MGKQVQRMMVAISESLIIINWVHQHGKYVSGMIEIGNDIPPQRNLGDEVGDVGA